MKGGGYCSPVIPVYRLYPIDVFFWVVQLWWITIKHHNHCLGLERQCKLLAPSQHKYCWARKWLIFYLLVMVLKNKTDLHSNILQNYANMYQYNACSLLWVLIELEAGTASCESPCSCMFKVIFYVPVFVMFSHHQWQCWNTDWVLCVTVMSLCPGLVRVVMSRLVMSSHHVIMLE